MSIDAGDEIAGHPAWQAALALTAVAGTLATACMMPLVAVAVMTAATMSARRAAATIGAIWAVNQMLGFTLLGYPPTVYAVAWGLALGGAAIGAMLVARMVLGMRERSAFVMLAAFGVAFATYEAGLYAFSLLAGGTDTFAPAIVARILLNDTLWLAGLAALYAVLTRAAPKTFGPPLSLRPA